MPDRVTVTAAAAVVIHKLMALHGPLLFHQSGGCCDGSSPMCYPRREFRVGAQDVFLGRIEDQPFFIGASQFEYLGAHPTHHRRGARPRRRLLAGSAGGRPLPDPQPRVRRRRGGGAGERRSAADRGRGTVRRLSSRYRAAATIARRITSSAAARSPQPETRTHLSGSSAL